MNTAASSIGATADRLERYLSRGEIQEVLARYARGVDRGDADLLKSCYHADAIEEHAGNYTGNAFAYIDGAVPRIRKMGVMQHLLSSTHIEFDGDVAWVETYVLTFARFAGDGRSTDTFTGGRLIDRFERRAGVWKIAHRRTVFDWNRDTPSNEAWCNGLFDLSKPGARVGRKDEQDPSYERF
jgi:hypothetical protein